MKQFANKHGLKMEYNSSLGYEFYTGVWVFRKKLRFTVSSAYVNGEIPIFKVIICSEGYVKIIEELGKILGGL